MDENRQLPRAFGIYLSSQCISSIYLLKVILQVHNIFILPTEVALPRHCQALYSY